MGSTGSGASARIRRFSGRSVGLGGKDTSGIMRVAATTRVVRVSVGVGEGVIEAVTDGEVVKVTVGESVAVKVAIAEGSVSGWWRFCVLSDAPPDSRYAKTTPLAVTKPNMPVSPPKVEPSKSRVFQ
jgi:hypothetical protein